MRKGKKKHTKFENYSPIHKLPFLEISFRNQLGYGISAIVAMCTRIRLAALIRAETWTGYIKIIFYLVFQQSKLPCITARLPMCICGVQHFPNTFISHLWLLCLIDVIDGIVELWQDYPRSLSWFLLPFSFLVSSEKLILLDLYTYM